MDCQYDQLCVLCVQTVRYILELQYVLSNSSLYEMNSSAGHCYSVKLTLKSRSIYLKHR